MEIVGIIAVWFAFILFYPVLADLLHRKTGMGDLVMADKSRVALATLSAPLIILVLVLTLVVR
jgi:hypothetical protein